MQKPEQIFPIALNLDAALEKLSPEESPFIKGVEVGINANPDTGGNNPTGEGQTNLDLTPTRSNKEVPVVLLPGGYNKNCGSYYSETTREEYHFNYNGEGNHGIYVISGDTGVWQKVIEDPNLPFTDDQENFLKDHRVKLRVLYDEDKNVIEKFLLYTNSAGWQGFIPVIAAIATDGFNSSLFPYYSLLQPHYDRRELIEWAVRPPMVNPLAVPIPNTPSDTDKTNRLIDRAFQFSFGFNNTDGRPSTFSPYSLPLIIKSEDFLNSPDLLSKNALLTFYAGSPLTESIDIYVRFTAPPQQLIASTNTYGDWQKVERIYKFSTATGNPSDVLSTKYWLRTNQWASYSYDPVQNTIQYVFDNSRLPEIVNQQDAIRLQNDIPLRSVALTDLNDAAGLGNNLYGYNNFNFGTINNLDVAVAEKTSETCPIATRKVRLYAYAARPADAFTYESQVGYIVGTDTQVRWGSLSPGAQTLAQFNVSQSKQFGLDFADHSAFVCYAKGTPFYSVGKWYQVNSDNSYILIPNTLDFGDNDVLQYVNNVFFQGGYFLCVFDFEIPAGRYDFAIGRHNVNISNDFRNTSTYVYGIANSRVKTPINPQSPVIAIKPNAIVSFSKEFQVDCTNSDIDPWGNGTGDIFYIYCPSSTTQGNNAFRFIEGYLQESPSEPIGVELFPYNINLIADDCGQYTDKNGFYWAYTKRNASDTANIEVTCKLNCVYPFYFEIPTSGSGIGWMINGVAYISDHNNGVVGDCNRILYTGKITNLDGTVPYSNIAISIVDGATAYTRTDGTFTLIIHNGQGTLRHSNIYVNASGNYLITILNCGQIPLYNFDESLVPCVICLPRNYPFQLILGVVVQGGTQFSLKENATYSIGLAGADLAGRLTYVNVIKNVSVPSFLTRDDVLSTYFQLLIKGAINLPSDIAYAAPYVSSQLNVLRYIQWVGDSIKYIDNSGNVVTDSATAVFVSIAIDSLYNYNTSKNFSLLSTYQFSPGDRLRILDDGNGNLLDTVTYGSPIDLQILGTNYNQAAMASDLIPNNNTQPTVNVNNNITNSTTVNAASGSSTSITQATTQNNNSITLYLRYDQRLDKLINDTGFWIELYTPTQQAQELIFGELKWYPVINGEIAEFIGIVNGQPSFNFPVEIDIPFWDTYLFTRNITIPNVGDKFLNHPFESSNISDTFGYKVSSGGRQWEKNDDAQQQWIQDDIIKSDAFFGNGIINGIGTFRSENRKNFGQYPFGGIIFMNTERGIVFVGCENDWFTVDFNFHFVYPNAQGIMITNLDDNLSTPHQKIGSNFGIAPEDTGTVIIYNKNIYWYDKKNESFVSSNYRDAVDISDIMDESGRKLGVKSYFVKKTQFISNWNISNNKQNSFDVVCGIDTVRNNLHVTFRNRKNNSNDARSYGNRRRNINLASSETIVYNLDTKRWTRFSPFTPEGYGNLKGKATGVEFISYAAGKPYYHNNTGNTSFINFYGIQYEPVFTGIFNQPRDIVKILQALSYDCTLAFYCDLIYTSLFNSFSYIPVNYFKLKEGVYYSQVLRNMNSYPPISPSELFRCLLQDGGRLVDAYIVVRFVGAPGTTNQYFQLNNIFCLLTNSEPVKK